MRRLLARRWRQVAECEARRRWCSAVGPDGGGKPVCRAGASRRYFRLLMPETKQEGGAVQGQGPEMKMIT